MTAEPHDTCWTVLRAASTGDTDARSTFARRYEPTIRFFLSARWRGRALAAEVGDATQEVFVECLKPGGVLERADAVSGDFRALLGSVIRGNRRQSGAIPTRRWLHPTSCNGGHSPSFIEP